MENKRNYAIDFFRILFMVIICIHHFQPYIEIKFIESGYLAVEFFFILSGFYLYKKMKSDKTLTSWTYTMNRIKKIFPLYILALIISVIIITIKELIKGEFIFEKLLFLPLAEVLMLQDVGMFNGGYNSPLWYISVLTWGGFWIFEFLKKDESLYLKIVAPILILVTFGLIKGEEFSTIENWKIIGGLYMPFFRGISDISIGCIIAKFFEKYREKIENIISKNSIKTFFLEMLVYYGLFYLIINNTKYELYCLILFPIIIILANIDSSWSSRIFNQKIFKNNSELSLLMYFNHFSVVNIIGTSYKLFLNRYLNDMFITIIYLIFLIIYSFIINKILKTIVKKYNFVCNNCKSEKPS